MPAISRPFALRLVLSMMMAMLLFLVSPGCRRGQDSTAAAAEQARLEAEFSARMTGSVLAGRFSSTRSDKIHEDRYTISKVSKLAGNVWIFQARIQYGDHDVNVPVPVKILWAGDTPVITLTDAGIPGLGAFTARVLFYRNDYAGTWSNDKGGGGQMFGRIERAVPAPAAGPQP